MDLLTILEFVDVPDEEMEVSWLLSEFMAVGKAGIETNLALLSVLHREDMTQRPFARLT